MLKFSEICMGLAGPGLNGRQKKAAMFFWSLIGKEQLK